MIKDAWDCVGDKIISNCWKHCGYIIKDDAEPIVTSTIRSYMMKLGLQLQKLDPDVFTAEEFVDIDDVECIESITDEAIINLVLDKDGEDANIDLNDNNNIEPITITHEEVKKSLQTIVSFVNNRKYNDNDVQTVNVFNNYMHDLLTNELVQGVLKF